MSKLARGFQIAVLAASAILFAIKGEWWTVSWIAVASLAVFEACAWKYAYENTQR